jgi:hypothetical protein
MKHSKGVIFLLLSIATSMLIITMLRSDNKDVKIISVNQVHSYLYTSDLETISIPLLINTERSHVLLKEAIDKVYITNESETQKLPLTLTNIRKDNTRDYNDYPHHQFTVFISPTLKTNDLTTHINDALLVITYHDYPELRIPIGSFSYSFYDHHTNHISIETRINIPKHIGQYPTSMGLYFNVNNKTSDPITITNISLLTEAVTPNINAIVELEDPTQNIDDLLAYMPENYNPLANNTITTSSLNLSPNSESFFLIPFSYKSSVLLFPRYPLFIEYTYQGEPYFAIYDDFLFIKTDPFLSPNDTLHNEVIYDDHF